MKKDTIKAYIKSYPWASTVAMLLDSNLISFLRFSDSQRTKRVINAFSIYVIPCMRHTSVTSDEPFPCVA